MHTSITSGRSFLLLPSSLLLFPSFLHFNQTDSLRGREERRNTIFDECSLTLAVQCWHRQMTKLDVSSLAPLIFHSAGSISRKLGFMEQFEALETNYNLIAKLYQSLCIMTASNFWSKFPVPSCSRKFYWLELFKCHPVDYPIAPKTRYLAIMPS